MMLLDHSRACTIHQILYSGCYLSLHTGPYIVPPAIKRATLIYNLRPEHVPEGEQRVDLGSERRKIIVVWPCGTR